MSQHWDGGNSQGQHGGQHGRDVVRPWTGRGSITSVRFAGAYDLLVALVVGREAGVGWLLLDKAATPLNAMLVVYVQLDDGLAAKGLQLSLIRTLLQVLLIALGTWRVHHEAGAIVVVVWVALVAAQARDCMNNKCINECKLTGGKANAS